MRFALVSPDWSFHGSFSFGCHAPDLPLRYVDTRSRGPSDDRGRQPTYGRHPKHSDHMNEVQDRRPVALAELELPVEQSWLTPARG